MKSKDKYKGKFTKRRLKNLAKGVSLSLSRQKEDLPRREKFIAVLWQNRGFITREQRIQWGYL